MRSIGLVLLAVSFLSSLGFGQAAKKSWTYLFYVGGDEPEIDPWSRVSMRRLERIGSSADRWLIAHADLSLDDQGKATINEPARRYEIHRFDDKPDYPINGHDFSTLQMQSPVVWSSAGETNSADPNQLRDFVTWGMEHYPAEHYALFILGHSWGWRGIIQDYNPGVTLPPSPAGGDDSYLMMSVAELGDALRSALGGKKLDLLALDHCNGGLLEFAWELGEVANTLLASVTDMPYLGLSYDTTFRRPIAAGPDLARQLLADTLASYARGGSSVAQEGEYPPLSLLALDLEKMGPFWQAWHALTDSLHNDGAFRNLFLGANNEAWQDLDNYADVAEIVTALQKNGERPETREAAASVLDILGEPAQPAPDAVPMTVSVEGADTLRLKFQGDELAEVKTKRKEVKMDFDYLNPSLSELEEKWRVSTVSPTVRTYRLDLALKPVAKVELRPFLAGVSWVEIESLRKGKVLHSRKLEAPGTYWLRTEFPAGSPYLMTGHTFGAGRSHGLAVAIVDDIPADAAESYHFQNGHWIGRKDYYRTLSFSRAFGWGDLLFQ